MRSIKYSLLISAICIGFGSAPATASEVFQWREVSTQFSATFPDDWRQVHNQKPDDVLTIMGPSDTEYAECRLRRRDDGRFKIFPREYAGAVQRTGYSANTFWDKYLGEYGAYSINSKTDNAGLGHEFATYADASFISIAGPRMEKRGIMAGGVYNDKAYIFECSAESAAFDKWNHTFLDILKSVNFRAEYSQKLSGKYRPFNKDGDLLIWNSNSRDDIYAY